MKIGMNAKLGMIIAVAGLALSSAAQVTTPPTQKPAPWPKETPQEPVTTRVETISAKEALEKGLLKTGDEAKKAEDEKNAGQPNAQPNAQPKPAPAPAEPAVTKQNAHSFFKEWERDGSGNVVRLDRPLHWAALERNTTIPADTRKKIETFIEQRRQKVEQTVVENIAQIRELDSGVIETFSMSDRTLLSKVNNAAKPFIALGSFPSELKKADLFTANNIQVHQTIVDDYRRLLIDEMKRSSGSEDNKQANGDYVARGMFFTLADEARQVYHWMLSDSAATAFDRVGTFGLAADVEPKVKDLFKQAKDAKDDSERIAKMREAVTFLTPEQTKALVEPVVRQASGAQKSSSAAAPTEGQ
ncbi:MAG: hypothetical protein K2Y21_11360 [Phycisphaerales bacterium]|nr:hypothetical protein [Phycisphaerales bacterium]